MTRVNIGRLTRTWFAVVQWPPFALEGQAGGFDPRVAGLWFGTAVFLRLRFAVFVPLFSAGEGVPLGVGLFCVVLCVRVRLVCFVSPFETDRIKQ